MGLLQTRGPEKGRCNICGEHGPLTVDHTPPKGFAPAIALQVNHVAERLGVEPTGPYKKAPDGVKYRSLCERCNRDTLGAIHDPALIHMPDEVSRLLTTPLLFPIKGTVRICPQKVTRSVLGHLCAQGMDRYEKGAITEPLRDYILDPSLPMPSQMRVNYWLYPHLRRVLIRDAVIARLGTNTKSGVWILKAYPLAFVVTWNRDFPISDTHVFHDFDAFANIGIDDEADVPIDLMNVPHQFWPESPVNRDLILMGEAAIVAHPSAVIANLARS